MTCGWEAGWAGEFPIIGRARLHMHVKVSAPLVQNVQGNSAQRGDLCRHRLPYPPNPPKSMAFLFFFLLTVCSPSLVTHGPSDVISVGPVWVGEYPLPSPKYPPGRSTMHLMAGGKGRGVARPDHTSTIGHSMSCRPSQAEYTHRAWDQRYSRRQ